MVIWILSISVFVTSMLAAYYKRKSRRCQRYKQEMGRLEEIVQKQSFEIGVKGRKIIDLDTKNDLLENTIREYKHLCLYGWLHLTTQVNECDDDDRGTIEVIGTTNLNPNISFIIKLFEFDKNSNEDREFAIREAKELIDKIYE